MSTGIVICDDHRGTGARIISLLGREYRIITATTAVDTQIILPTYEQTFTPPHKKQRRGKFKRSGK